MSYDQHLQTNRPGHDVVFTNENEEDIPLPPCIQQAKRVSKFLRHQSISRQNHTRLPIFVQRCNWSTVDRRRRPSSRHYRSSMLLKVIFMGKEYHAITTTIVTAFTQTSSLKLLLSKVRSLPGRGVWPVSSLWPQQSDAAIQQMTRLQNGDRAQWRLFGKFVAARFAECLVKI